MSNLRKRLKHAQDLIKRFAGKGYNELTVRKQIERVDYLDRSLLLKQCKSKCKDLIPFSVTYNPALPNIKKIIYMQWHTLSMNSSFRKAFKNIQPMIAFRKNTSLKQLIATTTINNNHKFPTPTQKTTTG